jgi:hypothetical protein
VYCERVLDWEVDPYAAAFEQVRELTPSEGFNLVGIDDFAMLGEPGKVYIVGHFETLAEAEAAQRLRRTCDQVDETVIYGPRDEEVG